MFGVKKTQNFMQRQCVKVYVCIQVCSDVPVKGRKQHWRYKLLIILNTTF